MLREFHASTYAEIKAGTAIFQVFPHNDKISITLRSFTDYHNICRLLDDARRLGEQEAGDRCKKALEDLSQELR